MRLIPLTKNKFAIVDDSDYPAISKTQWSYNSLYARRGKRPVVFMHHLILPKKDGYEIDHINGNKLDNRRSNLRYCKHSENSKNRRLNTNNTSGYKGVNFTRGKWHVRIQSEGKRIHIGVFDDKTQAALAYNKEAERLHRKFAVKNVI